ncbi:MAG: undecaprenyl-phosphate glucose phosphotransferase [Phycisphaerales bacterium]
MLKQRHQLFVALFCVADGVVVIAACMLAWVARLYVFAEPLPHDWEGYFKGPLVLFALPIVLYTFSVLKLYRARRDRSMWGEQGGILKACLVSMVLLIVALWAVGSDFLTRGVVAKASPHGIGWRLIADPARLQLLVLAILLPSLLGAERIVVRSALRAIRRRGFNLCHVAIIGVGRLGQIAARTLERNAWTGIHIAYFVSHHDRPRQDSCLRKPVLGGLKDLEGVLETNRVDAIYLALPGPMSGRTSEILKRLERFAVDVRIVPDVHPRYVPQSMAVSELEGMPILSYRESPITGLGGFTKRLLDIIGASLALLIFSPLMLAIAAAIRLTSRGPVIFKQQRVSLGGEVFKIYKFRTMRHVDDEQARPDWTRRDDPRITPVGGWLRRASLDELPQLINVLKGDMALVGPRPERPELIARFRDDWRGYMLRQHVKAGITGWAQVNGLRGDTSLRKRLQYDLFYIRHWSIWFDLRILWLTLFRGFVHRNAH